MMSDLELLKQEARKSPIAKVYLDGTGVQLAQEVINLRLKKGLSQAELAALAGVAEKTISQFEGGDPSVEIGILKVFLEEYGVASGKCGFTC